MRILANQIPRDLTADPENKIFQLGPLQALPPQSTSNKHIPPDDLSTRSFVGHPVHRADLPGNIDWLRTYKVFGDQARATLEGEVGPEPAHGHEEAIVEADEQIDMRHSPEKPGNEALELQASPMHDGGVLADHCQIAPAVEAKWRRGLVANDARDQRLAEIASLLVCNLGQTRQGHAVLVPGQS